MQGSSDSKFITLVIHTYRKAVSLRKILEERGMTVRFEKVSSENGISSGVRVKIMEKDLPMALQITESGISGSPMAAEMKMSGASDKLLIPVDFSHYSKLACKVGFDIAHRLGIHPVILHTFITPYFNGVMPFGDNPDSTLTDAEAARTMRDTARRNLNNFADSVKADQASGMLPDIEFSTTLSEGVPEEVILEYTRTSPPALVVMATRGRQKKEIELIGSVTAEVLDSARVPIFTVPENYTYTGISDVDRLVFFCNLDQQDILCIDMLMRMFGYPKAYVTLIPVNDRASSHEEEKLQTLRTYLAGNYPAATFDTRVFKRKCFREEMEAFMRDSETELLVVPNKRKNIFSRLFNPGIAHRILFERDIPMLVLPV